MIDAVSPLLIDDRDGSREFAHIEPTRSLCELTRLDSADACVIGNGPDGALLVGVEIKSIWDLLGSMGTGRLQATQIPLMLDTYQVCWLLYFGEYRPGDRGQLLLRKGAGWRTMRLGKRDVPYGYVEGFLLDLAAVGFRIKHCHDQASAAVWLGVLHRWWSRPWLAHKAMRTLDHSREISLMPGMTPDQHLRAKVAAALPGVGFERAIAAARHFTTVSDMINATSDEWAHVPGIGKVIARAVATAVR